MPAKLGVRFLPRTYLALIKVKRGEGKKIHVDLLAVFDAWTPGEQIKCHASSLVFFSIRFLLSPKKQLSDKGPKCNAESYSTSSIFMF